MPIPEFPQGRQARKDGWGRGLARWQGALARVRRAEAGLAGVENADDAAFDRALIGLNRALRRLLRTPAPHPAALATKLDLLVGHRVWELTFAPPCLAAVRRDARRLAATAAGTVIPAAPAAPSDPAPAPWR